MSKHIRSRPIRNHCIFLILFMLILGLTAKAEPNYYTITDLGTLPGSTDSFAYDINSKGEVVGYAKISSNKSQAFLYDAQGIHNIDPCGIDSRAFGINDSGQITGFAIQGLSGTGNDCANVSTNNRPHAFLYSLYSQGVMIDLGVLDPDNQQGESVGQAINATGQVIGKSGMGGAVSSAFFYDGAMQPVDTSPNAVTTYSNAYGINDFGQITGERDFGSDRHAFLVDNGVMIDLGTLPGGSSSYGRAINNHGQITGYSDNGITSHAFRYDSASGQFVDLGALSNLSSAGYGINDSGYVVGASFNAQGNQAGFVHNPTDNKMYDLNDLVGSSSANPDWQITEARAINNAGQIAATGYNGANYHALLLAPASTADLSVALAATPDPIINKSKLTLKIAVTNNGPNTATNAHFKISLPSNATFYSADINDCTVSDGTVDCTIGNLTSGQTVTHSVVVTPTVSGSASFTVLVSAKEPDPKPENNQDTKIITISPAADLYVSLITGTPDPAIAGSNLILKIRVANAGPDTATNVHIKLNMPEGMTFSSGSGCVASGALVDCTIGSLATYLLGGDVTQTVIVTPTVPGGASITASVSADTSDPSTANNQAALVTTVTPSADLSIALAAPSTVMAKSNLVLNITVANAGPSTAANVHVKLSLPTGMMFSEGNGCTSSGTAVDCSLDSLTSGQTTSRVVILTPSIAGNANITASVSADASDPSTANNQATVATTVTASDLSIALTGTSDSAIAGSNLTLDLEVANAGPSVANNVHVELSLPAGMMLSEGSGCTSSGTVIDCGFGSLASGQNISRTLVVIPMTAGNASITASASASEIDLNTANNQATLVTTVIPSADLSIALAAAPEPVLAGTNLTLTIKTSNHGPSTATNLHTHLILPVGMTFSSGNGCVSADRSVDCGLGDLTPGQTVIQTVIVTPTLAGSANIVASVSANEIDLITTNNQATVVTTVTPAADLSVTLAAIPEPVMVGAPLSLKVTVANSGPNTASSVHATFSLPMGMAFSSGSDCVAVGTSVDCSFGALASGQIASRTLIVTSSLAGKASLMVSVSANETDPSPANNQATVATTVTAADVSVALAAAPDPVMAGTNLTLTITAANNGPYTATNVQFHLALPTGTSFSAGNGCAAWGGSVICTMGNLASGQTVSRIVTVTPTVAGKASIAVSMSADQTDPDPANNQAIVATTVTSGPVDLALSLSTDLNPVIAGNELVYKAVVANKSFLTNASHVKLALSFPNGGVQFLAASPTCAPSNTAVICDLGNLAFYGGTALGFVHVRPTSTGILAVSASVTSAEIDSNPTDNQFTIITNVLPPIVNPTPTPITTGTPAPNSDSPMLVISPNGGELWEVNDKIAIQWNLPDYSPNRKVIVSLSKDGGVSWKKLKPKVRNTGFLRWKVRKAHVTNRALIRVCLPKSKGVSTPLCDVSDREFTITQ